MSYAEWLVQPSARLLTLALAHFLWQGCAVALLLVAIVELCNIRRAQARYACSLAALLVMVACPLGTLAWLGSRAVSFDQFTAVNSALHSALPENASLDSHHFAAWIAAAQPYALAAWLTGVGLFGGRLLGGAIGVLQLRRGRQPMPDKFKAVVAQLGRRLHINAVPLVFLSRHVAEAMAVGIVRPLVLIPAAWASEMPLDLLEAVIAHELAHLRRRDLWVNLLQRIIETVLFYHPAVWWLSRRLRIERELCADELAVAATGNRLAYAQALQQVAQQQLAPVGPLLAAFLRGEKDMRLLHRVRNVLRPAKDDRSRLWPAGLVALALPLGLWLASVGMNVAAADDEQEGDRPRKEAIRRVEIRQVEDRPRKEVARDGDRLRKEIVRDGDRPRKEIVRDGDGTRKPAPGAPRKREIEDVEEDLRILNKDDAVERRSIRRRDGELKVETELGVIHDSDARRLEELTALVKRLSAQVEKLQDEVSSLRARSAAGAKDEALREWRKTSDKVEKGEASDRDEAAATEKFFRLRGDVEKVISEKAKAAAEQQRAIAEKAAAVAREKAEQAKLQKEEIQELIERKQAEAKRAAEAAVRKKIEAIEREKERDIPEEERLLELKKRLRDEQSLLKENKPPLKEKPLTRKPLKEKPTEQ